jgi:hypothetical protein
VESLGDTLREPEGGTVPSPAIVTLVASFVSHVIVVLSPRVMTGGFAAIVAVGAFGAGGGTTFVVWWV